MIDFKHNEQKKLPHQVISGHRDNTHFLVLFIFCVLCGPLGLLYLLFGSKNRDEDKYIPLDKYGTNNSDKLDWIVGLIGMIIGCPIFYWWLV
nr:hypothetical protein 1 [bacterium]